MARPKSYDPETAVTDAMRTFWELGYHGASIDTLLERLRIRRQSLYDTFEDKAKLYSRSLARYADLHLDREITAIRSGNRPLDGLLRLIALWSQIAAAETGRGCLLSLAVSELIGLESASAGHVRQLNEKLEAAIRFRLQEAAESGDIHPDSDCNALASFLLFSRHGMMIMSRAGASQDAIRSISQELTRRLQDARSI